MSKDARTPQGLFITLEGVDGCGKSTQASLLREDLEALGFDVVFVREPGGTAISEQIRGVVLNPENNMMCDECELLLYEASRAQLVGEVIRPALAAGKIVLCDRFYDSTFAYQAAGRGLDTDLVHRANRLGSCGVSPDKTLVFMLEPTVAHARATQNDADRLEAEGVAFQERVFAGYKQLLREEPERVKAVDADGSIDEVRARTRQLLANLIPGICEFGE